MVSMRSVCAGLPDSATRLPNVPSGQALWMFLYYLDFDSREVRFELSQPTHMSEARRVDRWSTRFILPPMQFAPLFGEQASDDLPDIDIAVSPKQP
jgi:hypothetical protein